LFEKTTMTDRLRPGDRAPALALTNADGEQIRVSDPAGE